VSEFRVIVGLRLDRAEYYLGFDATGPGNADYRTVRGMLSDHLAELESQAKALRSVLATADPEAAERLLQDGVHVQVSEVVLRPRVSSAEFLPRLREVAGDRASLDAPPADDTSTLGP